MIFRTPLLALLLTSLPTLAGNLRVDVQGKPGDKGTVYIALCNSEKTLKDPRASTKGGFAKLDAQGKGSYTFKKLPAGDYAIKLFLDSNGNKDLDTNAVGLPKERYGFSNNIRPILGVPPWKKLKFKVPAKGTAKQNIKLRG